MGDRRFPLHQSCGIELVERLANGRNHTRQLGLFQGIPRAKRADNLRGELGEFFAGKLSS
jgi:hypothetical protein